MTLKGKGNMVDSRSIKEIDKEIEDRRTDVWNVVRLLKERVKELEATQCSCGDK